MEIRIEVARGPTEVHFEMEAEEALPQRGEMWPWIAWPAGVILLFGVHQWLMRKESSRRGNSFRRGASQKVVLPE
jgi:hypothetical protein